MYIIYTYILSPCSFRVRAPLITHYRLAPNAKEHVEIYVQNSERDRLL